MYLLFVKSRVQVLTLLFIFRVQQVKNEATKYGWEFDRKAFDDKKIRDRIRCFFKTHIQNAKKRLKTMLRNPGKKANIKALAAHFHLIEEKNKIEPPVSLKRDDNGESEDDERREVNTPSSTDVSAMNWQQGNDAQVAAYSEV
jgi:NADPH-dependent 2,4-dienoyl-CoA reductase/sulfur reductase-like enzyme